ncbi:MAG: TIGR03000 domain-containing protein [Planctomycetes bacterium]|nr:TIGR03000 domain-containing protein [Planctomycetota bacterium]
MYSVVLMMALSGGTEATEFGRHGCQGMGHGCHGAGRGCWGGSGCWGSGHSCHGGGLFNRNGCHGGGLFQRHGCHGGGCHGGYVSSGCYGGGCYGGGCHGNGCHGGGLFHRHNHGCCGGAVVYSSGCHGGAGTTAPPAKKEMPAPEKKGGTISAPATIIVSLPAEGKLRVDGFQTTSTGERRTLLTPAIPVGEEFSYELQAEITRDGRSVVQTQTITVRGGETTTAPFTFSSQDVASR